MMYYAGWCFQDASIIGCGLGYNGTKDGVDDWYRLPVIKILEIELGVGPIPMMKAWNHQVHLWLNRYV